jgi:hypothetical protein
VHATRAREGGIKDGRKRSKRQRML